MNLLLHLPTLLAQTDIDYSSPQAPSGGSVIGGIIGFLVWAAIIVLVFASCWKICEKAGRQGWEGIIPIYNYWVLAEIGGKPGWWGLMILIPCVGIVFAITIRYSPRPRPPAGVHLPAPSSLPVILSAGAAVMGLGLVFKPDDQFANLFLLIPGPLLAIFGVADPLTGTLASFSVTVTG